MWDPLLASQSYSHIRKDVNKATDKEENWLIMSQKLLLKINKNGKK
jgi:hypothetical protein